ncbi:alpha/beta hydrolase [Sphingomonas koreensis]|jgi:pimeloyl-ACP methyl ester carboxylesterase|uniref:alpha/beta fold hydrolase n=1 Tax=Sphingomonas koreensis TaxID=93064 RepID=UPI0009FC0793|nr:alpha/beta hydrolase [Sphingomonas koreensis]PJI89549.1 pimeloyl-ACP methyl ester carboxylesterase [Sphingomonas koreensis]RSU56610.1 alpha/beta hydrolase [Sphingomonas koreensis]RSU64902.1 alpha/beta hydrolase [Sphingomonas koreensis]
MTSWLRGLGGIRLAASMFGPVDGPPVLMLGGLGQTRHGWSRAAERLSERGWRAITLDLRGHGESDWSPDGHYGYARTVGDLLAVIDGLGRPCVLVGASLGGKISLVAGAQAGAERVRALVIVDTVPRTNPAGVAEVTQVLRAPPEGFSSPDEAAAELARIRGQEPRPDAGERMQRNMRIDGAGRWHWHWDPAWMDREQGIGLAAATDFLEEMSARLTMPVLLTRGERSQVVSDEGLAAFRAIVPQLEVESIAGAGHMIVGDRNDVFADATLAFLDRMFGLHPVCD